MGLGDVVERQDAPSQAGQEVCAEGDQGPEGQDGDDLGLDDGGEGDQLEVEGEVDLQDRAVGQLVRSTCWLAGAEGKE